MSQSTLFNRIRAYFPALAQDVRDNVRLELNMLCFMGMRVVVERLIYTARGVL